MKTEQEIKDRIKELSTNSGDSLTTFITILTLLWVLDTNNDELNQYAGVNDPRLKSWACQTAET